MQLLFVICDRHCECLKVLAGGLTGLMHTSCGLTLICLTITSPNRSLCFKCLNQLVISSLVRNASAVSSPQVVAWLDKIVKPGLTNARKGGISMQEQQVLETLCKTDGLNCSLAAQAQDNTLQDVIAVIQALLVAQASAWQTIIENVKLLT